MQLLLTYKIWIHKYTTEGGFPRGMRQQEPQINQTTDTFSQIQPWDKSKLLSYCFVSASRNMTTFLF